jgi:Transposase DDE domain
MAVDLDHRVILAQTARRGPINDCVPLRPLVSAAHERVPIGLVLADAKFDSERTYQPIRQILQAHSVIPAKRDGAEWQIQGVRTQMHQVFPVHLYRRRALIESLISAVKRKLTVGRYVYRIVCPATCVRLGQASDGLFEGDSGHTSTSPKRRQ